MADEAASEQIDPTREGPVEPDDESPSWEKLPDELTWAEFSGENVDPPTEP